MSNCRGCEQNTVSSLMDFGNQPIVHHLLKDPDEDYTGYPFELGVCSNCALMQIMQPISPDILYENYFTISTWKNQPHVQRLIQIIENLSGIDAQSKIFDIGCNDASFLKILRDKGYKELHGIEPTQDAFKLAQGEGFENIINDFFNADKAEELYNKGEFDLVVTRHVLEHITEIGSFLDGMHFALNDDGLLVIEIPDGSMHIEHLDYAFWEEHVNYFTLNSLRRILNLHGFDVVHHEITLFSGRCLTVFCQKGKDLQPSKAQDYELAQFQYFGDMLEPFKKELRNFLQSFDLPVYIYGSGCRSNVFTNFTGIGDLITTYIDDQPEKQNFNVPGKDVLKMVPWEDVQDQDFVALLGVNTENEYKVINKRGLKAEHTFSILPPSKHIPEFWTRMMPKK